MNLLCIFWAFRRCRQAKLATAHQAQGLDPFGRISLTQIDLQPHETLRIRGVAASYRTLLEPANTPIVGDSTGLPPMPVCHTFIFLFRGRKRIRDAALSIFFYLFTFAA